MIADSSFGFHKCLSPKGPNCEKLDIAMPVLTSGIVLFVAPQYMGRSSVCGLLPVCGTRPCGISLLRFRSLRARPERTRNFPESQCIRHRKSCFVSMLISRSIHTAGTGARLSLRLPSQTSRYRRSSFVLVDSAKLTELRNDISPAVAGATANLQIGDAPSALPVVNGSS